MRWLAAAVLVVAGCFGPDLGEQPFLCGTEGPPCPPGYDCLSNVCRMIGAPPPTADARPADAGGADAPVEPERCTRDEDCDEDQGELCFPEVGCARICGGGAGRLEGCELTPTAAGNVQTPGGFAVSLTNGGNAVARVRIDGGGLTQPRFALVPPRSVIVEPLPWVNALGLCTGAACPVTSGRSGVHEGAAYRILSTAPISAVQWSPVSPARGSDASRLLPARVLGREYVTASVTPPSGGVSFVAVTAVVPDTEVTVRPRATTMGAGSFPSIPRGTPHTVTLDRGDVLLLYADGDLAGTDVSATRVVQVLSGNGCASPTVTPGCGHVEEVMLPRSALSGAAIVPALPGVAVNLRVIAADGPSFVTLTDGNTTQEFFLAERGAHRDFLQTTGMLESVALTSNDTGGLLVAQTLVGAPAMTIFRPPIEKVQQLDARAWSTRVLTVTARNGDEITVDGVVVSSRAEPIAGSGWSRTLIEVTAGRHVVETGQDAIVGLAGFELTAGGSTFWY